MCGRKREATEPASHLAKNASQYARHPPRILVRNPANYLGMAYAGSHYARLEERSLIISSDSIRQESECDSIGLDRPAVPTYHMNGQSRFRARTVALSVSWLSRHPDLNTSILVLPICGRVISHWNRGSKAANCFRLDAALR